jgi:hypothetical protein
VEAETAKPASEERGPSDVAGPSRWFGDAIEYQSGSESGPEQFVKGPLEVPVATGWPMMPVACIWRDGRYHGEASPAASVSTGRTSGRLSRSGIASTPVATTPKAFETIRALSFLAASGHGARAGPVAEAGMDDSWRVGNPDLVSPTRREGAAMSNIERRPTEDGQATANPEREYES